MSQISLKKVKLDKSFEFSSLLYYNCCFCYIIVYEIKFEFYSITPCLNNSNLHTDLTVKNLLGCFIP